MSSIVVELFVISLLIFLNGLFAMAEIAVVSARKARLQQQANKGDTKARAALELANAPGQFLSTVQIGITLISILAGVFGGATIAKELGAHLRLFPLLAPYSDALGLGFVVLGITFFSLVFGELAPKQVALNHAERIAAVVAGPMRTLSVLATPAVRLLSYSTDAILKLLHIRPSAEPPVTEEEIKVLIEQGTQAGTFEKTEREMVESVFRLYDQRVSVLMTLRKEIVWLDLSDTDEEMRHKIMNHPYSRFPVGQEDLDNALGVVHAKDLLVRSLASQPIDLKTILSPLLFAPESMPASKLLEVFKTSHVQMALVVDEYGVVQGVITLNGVLSALLGDLPRADEPPAPYAVQREDGSWLLDGMLPVDKLKELFRFEQLPGEDKGYYQTLGGFVMMHMEHIPSPGQHFEWGGLRFEVVDMDLHRVDKVLVAPVRTAPVG